MKFLLKSLVLFVGLAAASPALAFSLRFHVSCADWKDPDLREDFWKEATPATIADCLRELGNRQGFSVKDRDDDGLTPLHIAAAFATNPNVISLLIHTKVGADVHARDRIGDTPLHSAVWYNSIPDVITVLINAGADVHAKNYHDVTATPLHYAAWRNHNPKVITVLLEAGADVNVRDKYRWTPLHYAAYPNFNPDAITVLLEAGADGSIKNNDSRTPFALALENSDEQIKAFENTEAFGALAEAHFARKYSPSLSSRP